MTCLQHDLPPLAPPLVYVIDAHDRILALNDAYLSDASAGHPAGDQRDAVRRALIGQVLWDVIPGVAEWYLPLVRRAREDGRALCFPFRCDTPELRRLMRMRITPDATGIVAFESAIVRVQPRERVELMTASGESGPAAVTMCSWCKRVDAAGAWVEVEEAMEQIGAEDDRLPLVSHGICPRCLEEITALATSADARVSIGLPSPS